jgi:hypothetical protein
MIPITRQIAADSTNAIALGASEDARRSTGNVMKILRSMNSTLAIKMTGLRFLKRCSSRLNREGARIHPARGFRKTNPGHVRMLHSVEHRMDSGRNGFHKYPGLAVSGQRNRGIDAMLLRLMDTERAY